MSVQKIQIGLRRFLLILATCATWLAYLGNEYLRSNANANLIRALKANRSLDVPDTSLVSSVSTSFQSGSSWSLGMKSSDLEAYMSLQCFVPNSGWEICIATRNLPTRGFPPTYKTAEMKKGTAAIELSVTTSEKGSEIKVRIEDKPIFILQEDKTWINASLLFPSNIPNPIIQSGNADTIELTRNFIRNTKSKDSNTSDDDTSLETNGVLLWLRRTSEKKNADQLAND